MCWRYGRGGAGIGFGWRRQRAVLPQIRDHRPPRIRRRTQDRIADEGYTIGEPRLGLNPPDRDRAAAKPRCLRERRNLQLVLPGFLSLRFCCITIPVVESFRKSFGEKMSLVRWNNNQAPRRQVPMIGRGACGIENDLNLCTIWPRSAEEPRRSSLPGVDERQCGSEWFLVFVPMHANVPWLLRPFDQGHRLYNNTAP